MSVYMILDAEVHDPVEYEKYKAAATIRCSAWWRILLSGWCCRNLSGRLAT